MIHPTAIIHPKAKLHPTVQVGPCAVVDEGVELGEGCTVGPHVYLTGLTTIGVGNRFHAGCVIGDAPQDLKYRDLATRLRIGDHNIFREHATVHRSNTPAEDTVIGSNNFLMAHSHVAHNCRIGDHVVLVNGALLGGHVTVADRAFLSGNCVFHQFVRVGTLALTQGGSVITQDLPPFTIAQGRNTLCGLNTVGLRRAGFTPEARLELRRVYLALFRSGRKLGLAVAEARNRFTTPAARVLLDFVAGSKRGLCADSGRSPTLSKSAATEAPGPDVAEEGE